MLPRTINIKSRSTMKVNMVLLTFNASPTVKPVNTFRNLTAFCCCL